MRVLLLVIGILFAGSLVVTQTPPVPSAGQPGTGRIRGRVVAAETSAPLREARVVAFIADGQPPRETVTDANGRYEFRQLPAGAFVVSASLDGYLSVAYGQQRVRSMESGTAVNVAPGQTVERIDLSLPRASVIVVALTDESGEPLAGAQVEIQRHHYAANGQRRMTSAPTGIRGPARTDDRGELRAFGLMPGEYTVRASVQTIRRDSATTARDRAEGFTPTYYPGTTRAADAQFVTLGLGDERTVQFAMVASRLHRVTGNIVTSDGQPPTGMDLQLAPGNGESGVVYGAGTAAADGTFAIAGVPDGSYTLQVRQNARTSLEDLRAGQSGGPFLGRVRGESVSVPLTVRGDDVTGLRIVTSRGATISGRVVLEGASTVPSTPELRVVALAPGLAGSEWFSVGTSVYDFPPDGGVAADGRFQIAGASGRVQLDVPTADLMVKSVTLDGRDVTDEVLDLTGTNSVSGVVITLTDKVSTVAGQVHGRDGQPVRNYVVVLLPRDPTDVDRAPRWIHTSRAGTDGRFQIRRVRPGHYLAAAVEWIEQGQQFAPEFQQLLRRGARELTVGEGQTSTLDLTLTPDI
ncbi:MAG TPA: carboxypeptidase regulatory-like domain-containing protein [Vicinamibacterales bacterium]|nr:carboxypeptidase regulatory-like domain-containing protein [Vicinamibacterales bacterium]